MTFHRRLLEKPDGRPLYLYARRPFEGPIEAPAPEGAPVQANPHLRWHPLRGEWVDYAGHRQERTFLPPPEWDPLAPTVPGRPPTEVPAGPWDVAVFENRFPALASHPKPPPPAIVDTMPGKGACEVVVYTQDRNAHLAQLPLDQVRLLVEVWADRTRDLGAREEVRYVMPFENRGIEVGATLSHPHGQIYAYPFVPPVPARELEMQRAHFEDRGTGLIEDLLAREREDGRRIVFEGDGAIAFVPVCARYPYEVWIAPLRPVPALTDLDDEGFDGLARALKTVVQKYDGLHGIGFPYVMVIHQAPCDGASHPEAHVHFEFYPAYRAPGKLKYLAGTEIGAGMFANDALPEEKAAELRAVEVAIEEPAR